MNVLAVGRAALTLRRERERERERERVKKIGKETRNYGNLTVG